MKGLTAGACVFFLAFAAARDVCVSFTYDEAAAYIRYIDTASPSVFDTTWLSLFNFEVATNHFLNTVATKLVYLAGGSSELVLRLPNLFGYAVYLVFSLMLLHRFVRSRAAAFAGFLLLNLNPYVLDFFTLSRGYGLSLGLLMGALFFLFDCLDQLRGGHAPVAGVSRTLLCAGGAVLANFALLNVYLAVFAVLLCALAVSHRTSGAAMAPAIGQIRGEGFLRCAAWPLLAGCVFSALVLSQDAGLSGGLYQPVLVKPLGLEPAAMDRVRVSRIDLRGRETRVRRDADGTWRLAPHSHVRGVKLELPVDDAARLARIEVIIGAHPFSSDPLRHDVWAAREVGGRRIFESGPLLSLPRSQVAAFRPLMNWTGDRIYFRTLAASTAGAAAILGGLVLAMWALGRLAVHAKAATPSEWNRLACAALWLAALVGTPLYLLRRDGQLYYGGVQGLVADTFFSLIDNSFYGRSYVADQNHYVLAAVLVTVAAFPVVVYAAYRRRGAGAMLPLACTLTIGVLVSIALVVQRRLFGTVYLLGRTALFYIPLYVLFFSLLCDAIHRCGRTGRVLASAMLAISVSCSAYHFARTANLSHTWDWLHDANTKEMMGDLSDAAVALGGPGSRAVLGVDWMFTPVAVYYARKTTAAGIEVVGLPAPFGADFFYLEEVNARPDMHVVKRYPLAGSVLVKAGGAP